MRDRVRLWPLLLPLLGVFFFQQRAEVPNLLEVPADGQWTAADRPMWKKFQQAKQGIAPTAQPVPKGHPELFAKILHEMKIPADRTTPEYAPGYRRAEAAKAMRNAKRGPALPWMARGPGNVAGRARAIVVDPDDATNSTWYIGTAGGGIWKTTDSGATWTDSSSGLGSYSVGALAMAESNHDVMYAGTGEGFNNTDATNGQGLFKSTDRGATWTLLPGTDVVTWENVTRVVVDPTDEDIVLASTTTGFWKSSLNNVSNIWRSTDGGSTFSSVYSNSAASVEQIVATPGDFNVLYATVNSQGIVKSTNAGLSWSTALSTPGLQRIEIAISPVDTDRVYASVWASPTPRFFYTTNAAASWTETTGQGNFLGGQGWYDNTIVCHPTNVNIVYVGGQPLNKITITGSTAVTTSVATGPVHVDYHGLTVLDDGGGNWRILAANDGGVGLSGSQDTNWDDPKDGMLTTQFYGADKRPGRSQYVGGMQDNSSWISNEDSGATNGWSQAGFGDGFEATWHFFDGLQILTSSQFNSMRRTLDGGATWEENIGPSGQGSAPFITRVGKSYQFPRALLAVTSTGVYRTSNFGASWSFTSIPVAWGSGGFRDVRMSRADGDICWAGARMDGTGRIFLSTNRGVSWTQTNNYGLATLGSISGLATHPTDPNTAYACFSFGQRPKILRTTDQGSTWTDISGFGAGTVSTNGFPDVATYDVMVFPNDTNKIWAGTEIGLVESLDGGATWAMATNGFPQPTPIWQFRQVEDEIVVATHGRGVWSVNIPGLSSVYQYRPLLDGAEQGPDGVVVDFNLRSAYDSTEIRVNGSTVQTLGANAAFDKPLVVLPVVADENWDVRIHSFIGATEFVSVIRNVDVFALQAAQPQYSNNFDPNNGDLTESDGFNVGTNVNFTDNSLDTFHSYADARESVSFLKVPITVASANATVEFDEVVLIEPGEPGSVFGDDDFWDYVIVEGSTGGGVWLPLLDGYDSRTDTDWLNEWNSSFNGQDSTGEGDETLYRHRVINLLDTFNPGDTVLIRFRLFADAFVHGWGWAIDNLEIQTGATAADSPNGRFALQQNLPNPFNPNTTIQYSLAASGPVSLKVYDLRGREVRTLVSGVQDAGPQSIQWNGVDNGGRGVSSGTYLYRLVAGEQVLQKKMTLLK